MPPKKCASKKKCQPSECKPCKCQSKKCHLDSQSFKLGVLLSLLIILSSSIVLLAPKDTFTQKLSLLFGTSSSSQAQSPYTDTDKGGE